MVLSGTYFLDLEREFGIMIRSSIQKEKRNVNWVSLNLRQGRLKPTEALLESLAYLALWGQ